MNQQLLDIIDRVIETEGGDAYTDHPKDRGGPTRFGITEATARAFGWKGDMMYLPREVAVAIYANRFWYEPKLDSIALHSTSLAIEMLDWGVTSNPSRPIRAMQRALNSLNREARDFPDISTDGRIGPMTIYALSEFLKRRGIEGARVLIELVQAQRRVFYMEITESRPANEEFNNGWQSRVR